MRKLVRADACEECGGDSCVLETRYTDRIYRRKRQCLRCEAKWTTHEVRVKGGQTVVALPLAAIRDLRNRVTKLLGNLGAAVEAVGSIPSEEDFFAKPLRACSSCDQVRGHLPNCPRGVSA